MAIGRNSQTLIGLQSDAQTAATELTKYLATSNNLNSEAESQQSEALTGERFVSDEFVTAINNGGEIGLELSKGTLPDVLKLTGLTEKVAPTKFVTTVEGSTSTVNKITVKEVYPFAKGDNIKVGTETAVVKDVDYRNKVITLEAPLTTAPAAEVGVTNETKFAHLFEVNKTVDAYATVIKHLTDENYHEKYIGCKVNSLDLSVAKKSYITASLNILGLRDEIVDGNPVETIKTLAADDQRLYAYGTSIFLGGENYDGLVDEFNLSLSNNFDDDDRGLNDIYRRDLVAQGSELAFDFQAKFDKKKYIEIKKMMKNNTYTDLKVQLDEGVVIVLPKVKLTETNSPVDGTDRITVSVNGTALFDSTTATVMQVILVDKNSSQY